MHDRFLFLAAPSVAFVCLQALAKAIITASEQRSNPPSQAQKLLEQFSSPTILPAFH